jgi:uncharacterized membrane protein YcjF (UPF0283 family)
MSEIGVFDDLAKDIVKKISEETYESMSLEEKEKYVSEILNEQLLMTSSSEEMEQMFEDFVKEHQPEEYVESMYWLKGFIILILSSFGLYTINNIYKLFENISFVEIFGTVLFIVNVIAGIQSFRNKL